MSRSLTRRQRYAEKFVSYKKLPVSIAAINFQFSDNLAFLIRTVACFGASNLFVIGHVPDRSELNSKSGTLYDFVNIISFRNTSEFLGHCRLNSLSIVSMELTDDSISAYDYSFDYSKESVIVLGNEYVGVPADILHNSDVIHIPMNGVVESLNVSVATAVTLYEAFRQRKLSGKYPNDNINQKWFEEKLNQWIINRDEY